MRIMSITGVANCAKVILNPTGLNLKILFLTFYVHLYVHLTPICELWTKNPQTGNMMERHLWTKNPLKIRKIGFWECQGASFVDKKSTLILF